MNTTTSADTAAFQYVFRPTKLGAMSLRNRIMIPPHGSAIGDLWGSEDAAAQNIAYWKLRADDGAAWVDAVRGRMQNRLIPGFEPHGYGAETGGNFRAANYVERVKRFVATMHEAGAVATAQLTVIGGVPHAPSNQLSSPLGNARPHVLSREDICWYRQEYRFSAQQARAAGLDGLELHLNHDDLLEWFLSAATNHRDDEYGGSVQNRARFAVEILAAVRKEIGPGMALGVRLNMREEIRGGYQETDGIEIARYLEQTGLIDFFHLVIGSPWGNPSYIQPQHYEPAQWSALAGAIRKSVSLPVVYTGRVNSIEVAERVLAAGHADVVGMARAYIAEPEILTKARSGRLDQIRPCVGGNDCISRRYMEGLPFGCAVNPHASREIDGPWARSERPRRLLVVGGGPAGMELAALCAEAGHAVEIWEAESALGGQLRIATAAPSHDQYQRYLDWQQRRLAQRGVSVRLARRAEAADVLAAGADAVAVATGATPYRPQIPGVAGEHVADITDVLLGRVYPGKNVVIVAQDDHLPPLSVADYLSGRGHDVTLVYATAGPAQLLGRYILGGILARLYSRGVRIRFLEEVIEIAPHRVSVANVYSRTVEQLDDVDSVVLACGGNADSRLYQDLLGKVPELHLLGDAFAPRRLVFATRQAYALAKLLAS
jgi:2,4-dienoyl-CoA reductase-like NADH-dependent reductase (Old Yellow Enzyme family)/thioredoxin reductase